MKPGPRSKSRPALPFQVQRLGVIMEPEPGNPLETAGVLNPGAARGPDGHLYLFPRLVARGNYSRIGIARVRFDAAGDPCGVERLGIALEPQADYELRPGGGGCEDPRITFLEPFQRYFMTYTALGPNGPRIALASSEDLFEWRREGLATFLPANGLDFNEIDNKDALLFPQLIPNPYGQPSVGMIHRPLFPGTYPHQIVVYPTPRRIDIHRESIWISYCTMPMVSSAHGHVCHFSSHHRLASPVAPWERLKIGGGTPPLLTQHGWLFLYHGVSEVTDSASHSQRLCYSAGLMTLARHSPQSIRYRSPKPILTPAVPEELTGVVADVVFPTGIDCRLDREQPRRFDIYYGMADTRIGVARLDLPGELPLGARAHLEETKV